MWIRALIWFCIILITIYSLLSGFSSYILLSIYEDFRKDLLRDPTHEYKMTLKNAIDNIPCYNIDNGIPIMTKNKLKDSTCLNKNIIPMEFTKSMTTNSWSDQKTNTSNIFSMICAVLLFMTDHRTAIATVTGGTSGNSFFYWYNKPDAYELLKSYFFCWETFGWNPNKKVLIYYGHPSSGCSLIKYLSFCNINALLPVFHNGDIAESSIIEFIAFIEQNRPYIVESMPNFIFRIAQYIYCKGIQLRHTIHGLSLSGDFLFHCQYEFIRRVFAGTTVLLSYGAVEFGQIAQQATSDDLYTYRIFRQISHVENIGDTLAITRYRYYNMPIIRYNVDDIGRVSEDGMFITDLVGKGRAGVDLLAINNAVEKLRCPDIINVRIRNDALILTVLGAINASLITTLEILTGYRVSTILCNDEACPTMDNMEGKVTPILS